MSRYKANMPSVGITSFWKLPIIENFLSNLNTDVGFLGIPYDVGNSWRPGTRFGPREIRNYSTRYSGWGGSQQKGYWDINQNKRFLEDISMSDCGDVDVAYYDIERNKKTITQTVKKILKAGTFPVVIGGDHSITYPCICAFEDFKSLDIIQIDAHLDWIDEVDESVMQMAVQCVDQWNLILPTKWSNWELDVLDQEKSDYNFAKSQGSQIFTRQDIRQKGVDEIVEKLPPLGNVYVSIDIDGLDPSIAPGTGSPTVDGLLYYEVINLLKGITKKSNVVGFDIVEVNPMVDLSGQTCLLAPTLILEFLGMIFDQRTDC